MPNSNNEEYPIGVFISTYTGDELFLADHIIQGKKILPGMAYLEIARAAIATSVVLTDKQMIVLKDSIFIQAILVTEKRSIEVQVYPGLDGEFGVEVSTDQGIHFKTKVFVKDKQELLKEIQIDKLNIHEIDQRCVVLGPTKQQFYENMAKRQVILGPSHRGIESIKIGSNEALIKLSLPNSSKRAMVMDPGMLDSVIQSAIALSDNPESNVVPFAVRNTKIFGALTDEMYAHVIKNEDSVDYVIADLAGEIKVVINGFVAREIDLNSKEDQLVFYKPKWQVDDDFIEVNNLKVTLVEEQPTYASLVKSIITTVQKLAVDRIDQEHTLVVNVNENEPAWRGIVGLLKTVILEYPKIKCILKYGNKAVRLDYDEMDMTAQSEYKWEDNKTILITGGMGGIGRIIAQDIAHNSKGCTIILVGRSKLSNEKKEFINSLEALGVKAIYVTCDVTNQAEVANLIAEHTNITGIIHGSGINRDNLINNKNLEEVDEVLEPKVLGLKYLDQASESLKLDYFITLSSIAGALGNVGQVDYAAANAYMDAYMENRMHRTKNQQCYGKSISINCPLWENGGMKLDETIKQNLRQVLKIKPMPDWVGLTALKTIMAGKECQAVVMFGNRKTIVNLFNNTIGETTKGLDKEAVKVEVNELTTDITKRIKLLVAEHLKLQSDNLDEILDWADFGFDSILLASFINRFNAQYNMSL
ncbi:MAG: SDR family NAD(P)-dependent oxidoreductase, partial [Prevotella sp.]|nr:SDR family NAD(P)-dependent oxidoreductase [Prevotella sp.]